MRAEDTLQYMADFYPDLFPTRKHCLNQLFCVIGNGYKWKKGELVDPDNIYEKRYQLRKPIKKAEFPNEAYWEQMHEITKTLSQTDCSPVASKYSFSWYPLSESSYLYRVPKNIKADWQALREECIRLLKEDGVLPENFNEERR